MVQITVRLPEDVQELLKYESLRSGKSQNTVITEALVAHLESERDSLDKIKQAVVAGRGKGRRPQEASLKLARKAASLDDGEGPGTLKATHRKPKR